MFGSNHRNLCNLRITHHAKELYRINRTVQHRVRYLVADAMLKAADTELLLSRSICSGKYMTMVRGDVAAVMASVQAGVSAARGFIVDTFIIPNLHESVFPAIYGTNKIDHIQSPGILESFSVRP